MNWLTKISQQPFRLNTSEQLMFNFPDLAYYNSFEPYTRSNNSNCYLCGEALTPEDAAEDVWVRKPNASQQLEFNIDPQMLRKMIDNYFQEADVIVKNLKDQYGETAELPSNFLASRFQQLLMKHVSTEKNLGYPLSAIIDNLSPKHFFNVVGLEHGLQDHKYYIDSVIARIKDYYDVLNQQIRVPVCKSCALSKLSQCTHCSTWVNKEDVISTVEGDNYCYMCSEYAKECTGCKQYFSSELKHISPDENFERNTYNLCESCKDLNESKWMTCEDCSIWITSMDNAMTSHHGSIFCPNCFKGSIEQVWQTYGDLDTLQQVVRRVPLSDDEYIRLFTKFPWSKYYGGEKWAEIAKTNKELKKLAKQKYNIDIGEATLWIDHAFDLAHNTGSLFSKLPNYIKDWLMLGLEVKKHTTPYKLTNLASPEVQHLMLTYMWLTGGVSNYQMEASKVSRQYAEKLESTWRQLTNKEFVDYLFNHDLEVADFAGLSICPLAALWLEDKIDLNFKVSLHGYVKYTDYEYTVYYLGLENPENVPNLPCVLQVLNMNQESLSKMLTKLRHSWRPQAMAWVRILENNATSKTAMVKEAQFTTHAFYDFYLLSYMDVGEFYEEDRKKVLFYKRDNILKIINFLIDYINDSMLREAKHVEDKEAIDFDEVESMGHEKSQPQRQHAPANYSEAVI